MWPFSNNKTKSKVCETPDVDPRSEETVEVEEMTTMDELYGDGSDHEACCRRTFVKNVKVVSVND